MYGPLPGTRRSWSARAIYQIFHDPVRKGRERAFVTTYSIDIVHDRAALHPEGERGADMKAFCDWIDKKALPWLRKEVERIGLMTSDNTIVRYEEAPFFVEATPASSYGYLYIRCGEREAQEATS